MSKIVINHAKKQYGDNTVIDDLSLDIHDGEFFTLLGPSGCGKTTLLRMIAGFNSIEGGDFYFNDRRINDLDPSKRNIGMVFQNYAIFPHLTVRKNVAFGLNNRKVDPQTKQAEVDRFLKMMQIDQYADRLPQNLSGGQQQRVALARALVIKPDVLLMDEPLSNLDAKLRLDMRKAIRNIQREVGITTVYVTHDQEEAMSISDRIAIMNFGEIQHTGTPREIYQRPRNLFVATFIGRSNILDGQIRGGRLEYPSGYQLDIPALRALPDQAVKISVRPEEFKLAQPGGAQGIPCRVDECVYLGLNTQIFLTLSSGEQVEIVQESTLEDEYRPGAEAVLAVNAKKINVFNQEGTQNLLRSQET